MTGKVGLETSGAERKRTEEVLRCNENFPSR